MKTATMTTSKSNKKREKWCEIEDKMTLKGLKNSFVTIGEEIKTLQYVWAVTKFQSLHKRLKHPWKFHCCHAGCFGVHLHYKWKSYLVFSRRYILFTADSYILYVPISKDRIKVCILVWCEKCRIQMIYKSRIKILLTFCISKIWSLLWLLKPQHAVFVVICEFFPYWHPLYSFKNCMSNFFYIFNIQ